MTDVAQPPRVPAVRRAFDVLNAVATHGPGTLSALARRLDLPKSSMLGICQTLVEERLLRTTPAGYALGLGLLELASAYNVQPTPLTSIAMCVPNLTNPFFTTEADAAAIVAGEIRARIEVFDGKQDPQHQVQQLEQIATSEVQAVILDAVDSRVVGSAVDLLRDAGITVVAVNAGASNADALVATDNVRAGALVARHLADQLHGNGNIAVVGGTAVTAVADRIAGFLSAMRERPGIRVVLREDGDNSESSGYRIARRFLSDGHDIHGIFAINDPTAVGVLRATHEQGYEVPIVSIDGSREVTTQLHAHSGIVATAAQDPAAMGHLAVQLAAELHAGRRRPGIVRQLPPRLITSATRGYRPWDRA